MQNPLPEISTLKAVLNNGITVSITCETQHTFHKTFLKGMVHTNRYKVTVVEPKGIDCPFLYETKVHTARWWWKFIHGSESRSAVAIHLLSLKARLLWKKRYNNLTKTTA